MKEERRWKRGMEPMEGWCLTGGGPSNESSRASVGGADASFSEREMKKDKEEERKEEREEGRVIP